MKQQDIINAMVNKFLGWKLPDDFSPDCSISFREKLIFGNHIFKPTGTNLFTATQAKAMFEFVAGEVIAELLLATNDDKKDADVVAYIKHLEALVEFETEEEFMCNIRDAIRELKND